MKVIYIFHPKLRKERDYFCVPRTRPMQSQWGIFASENGFFFVSRLPVFHVYHSPSWRLPDDLGDFDSLRSFAEQLHVMVLMRTLQH